jgi:hypothetical protein
MPIQTQRKPLTLDQAQSILNRMAKGVGQICGTHVGVGRRGDDLVFVDDIGDAIIDEISGEGDAEIKCASSEEILTGEFLKYFAARAFYAATAAKFPAVRRSEEDR